MNAPPPAPGSPIDPWTPADDAPAGAFLDRHVGPRASDVVDMLRVVGASSLDALMAEVIPADIQRLRPLTSPTALSEHEFLRALSELASRNEVYRSHIGLGYYDCITPSVIVRNVLENPGWYTPYTPYQAEIAQGRLEGLLNFQTVATDLTGMDVATASLLDEATAAAEAMAMLHRVRETGGSGVKGSASVFFVSQGCYPQTIEVVRARAEPIGIRVVVGDADEVTLDQTMFGALLQTPDEAGAVHDLRGFIARAHEAGVLVVVATDLLSLALVTPAGEMGADVVVGSAQRFGVPLGYGGPHAAFFATRERYVRQTPGRIIGVSVDAQGQRAYRMSLQTREQHIRREKATSNICTAQALLANIAGLYAVYHGPDGLRGIAARVHRLARSLEKTLRPLGVTQENGAYFDTVRLRGVQADRLRREAEAARLNFRYRADGDVGIALDETTSDEDLATIVAVVARAVGKPTPEVVRAGAAGVPSRGYPEALARRSEFLTHPVFHVHRSESGMMRYVRALERKDIGLDRSMIPLGSCTMKLNAASEMLPITWPSFSRLHPFAPVEQAAGYQQIFRELEQALADVTGFDAVSLQPNSGAQGELAGLMVIRAYHRDRGEAHRDVVVIPASAHGTNPASAAMAGMTVVVVRSRTDGSIDVDDLRAKCAEHRSRVAALMVTYPSTHGVFEEGIREVCAVVRAVGGLVYMDGANMNAQVGLTSPAIIGADVCHLNLHKTFAIPHGGGGPGMGPIAVAPHLAPYLPTHPVIATGGPKAIAPVAAAPWGSADILLISYAYIRMLGGAGMTHATRIAILNANYVKQRLSAHYPVLYTRANGRVAHEMILDLRQLTQASGIDEIDVAKRLMDYGFHAPTVSFPVAGTLMVEPTESEPRDELDRFCDAMIAIRGEIQAIVDGRSHPTDNPLKNAPHTAVVATSDEWRHPYTREQAVFPLPFVKASKFWPSVGRIDNPFGDRHLVCTCPPIESYVESE